MQQESHSIVPFLLDCGGGFCFVFVCLFVYLQYFINPHVCIGNVGQGKYLIELKTLRAAES